MATALSATGVPAEPVAIAASAGSWFLTGVQQAATPNLGDYSVSAAIGQVTGAMAGKYPLAAPIFNEFGNVMSNSAQSQQAKNWVNANWEELIRKWQ